MKKKGFLFKNLTIFDGFDFFEGSVLTNNNIIKNIFFTPKISGDFSDYEIIEGNYILLPGLVNTHTHIPMAVFKGVAEDLPLNDWLFNKIFPLESKFINKTMCQIGSKLAIAEMLLNGITAFNDMYFFEEEIANSAQELGIKVFLGEGIVDFKTPAGLNGEESLELTENFAKKYKDNPYVFVSVAPHSAYLTNEKLLLKSFELSKKYDLPFHIHTAETLKETEEFEKKMGIRLFEYFNNIGILNKKFIGAHSVHLLDKEIEIMAKHKITISHCPSSNTKLGSGIARINDLLQAGVNITIATDGSASNNRLDLIREAELTAKLQKGISNNPEILKAKDVLKMITSNTSLALGENFGTIKKGGKADLVLFSKDDSTIFPVFNNAASILYSSSRNDIKAVFVEGKKVVENGKLTNTNLKRIIAEAKYLIKDIYNFIKTK
jgi:5-methylthioadenosine/S-adenosylhomocysteine deaminase